MSKTEKYGFIYLWYDKKLKRYYIGCHWGTENDGYVCSSTWMLQAYYRRPQDFKRRIIKVITTNRLDLFKEEERWLNMITSEELGIKYYNKKNSQVNLGHWSADPETAKKVIAKFSKSLTGKKYGPISEAKRKKLSDKKKAYYAAMTPEQRKAIKQPWTDEQKAKNKASYQYKRTKAQKAATKQNQKLGAEASPITKPGWIPNHRIGTKHTEETLQKMRDNNCMKRATPEQRKAWGDAISKGKIAANKAKRLNTESNLPRRT